MQNLFHKGQNILLIELHNMRDLGWVAHFFCFKAYLSKRKPYYNQITLSCLQVLSMDQLSYEI